MILNYRINKMLRFSKNIMAFLLIISSSPIYADNSALSGEIILKTSSKKSINNIKYLGHMNDFNPSFALNYNKKSLNTRVSFSTNLNNNLILDHSYIQKKTGNKTYGVGALDRHWSFSDRSSLIMSSNSRPTKSIYFKFEDNKSSKLFERLSFDIFNGISKGVENPNNSMLFGTRIVIAPAKKLELEFFKLSQWGGDGYDSDPSVILKSFFGDTNDGKNANINQLAGFGLSYSLLDNIFPTRFYFQAAGEDEAGNLPSCFMYLAGVDWKGFILGNISNLGAEITDTTIDYTTNGYCGPNTAYNNGNYKYSNYGIVMGTPIDSEGKSFELYGSTNFDRGISINFNIKKVLINSDNWEGHRLTSKRTKGWFQSTGISFKKNNFSVSSNLTFQDFQLEKIKSSKGVGLNVSTSYSF